MLHLRCLAIHDDIHDAETKEFQLDLANDPARWLLTLNVCRLAMPDDTDPIHLTNWSHIEALLEQLSTIYTQTRPSTYEVRGARRGQEGLMDQQ